LPGLERGVAFADRASDLLFRQGQVAQTFGEADLTPFERFPYNGARLGGYESLDIDTARHAQLLLCYEMYDRPLGRGRGAPLRLSLPTKLGYKHLKYLLTLDVGFVRPVRHGYWSDQGYSWYAGL